MSERPPHRRPATFKLDDPHVTVIDADDEPGRLARGTIRITPEADPALLPAPIEEPAVTTSIDAPPRSAWMAGTTSHLTNSWN